MNLNDRVRVIADEYPELVGTEGTVTNFSKDMTTAWVASDADDRFGMWCSVSNLVVIEEGQS